MTVRIFRPSTPGADRMVLETERAIAEQASETYDEAVKRANHTGTQSADTLTDGTTNKAFLATERTKLAGIATGATANSSDAYLLARTNHTGTQSADTLTDGTTNKAFLATERTKLAGIATGATANSSDATLLARANHTGTQPISTISDYTTGTWTATVTAAAGAGFTATGTGQYTKIGNVVEATVECTISANGSGSSYIKVSLPPGLPNGAKFAIGIGNEYAATGTWLGVIINPTDTVAAVQTLNSLYPGGTGYTFTISFRYFV